MKQKIYIVLVILISLLFASPVLAQSIDQVLLLAPEQRFQEGDSFEVKVIGSVTTPINGMELYLTYEPDCIKVGEITSQKMSGFGRTDIGGTIVAAFTQLGGQPFSGELELLSIQVQALKSCQTALSLEGTYLISSLPDGMTQTVDTMVGEPVLLQIQSIYYVEPTPAGIATATATPIGNPPIGGKEDWLSAETIFVVSLAALGVSGSLVFFTLMQKISPILLSRPAQKAPLSPSSARKQPQPARQYNYEESPTLYENSALFSTSSLLLHHNGTQAKIPLVNSPFNIGRIDSNHLRLNSANISRLHAQLIQVGNDWYITDNHSRNGTFVNNQRVANSCQLNHGDEVRLGQQIVMVFE